MPLSAVLLSYVCGLLSAPYLYLPSTLPMLIFCAAGAWLVGSSSAYDKTTINFQLSSLCLILCFFCIGLFQYKTSITPPEKESAIHHMSGQKPVILEGVIESMNTRYPQGAVCLIEVHASLADGLKTEREGKLLLYIEQLDAGLSPGDLIRFRTRLRVPRPFGTPGEFNYPRHLAHQSIFTTGFAFSSDDIVRLESNSTLRPGHILGRWRQDIGALIDASVPVQHAPYIRGLAIGDRGSMSPEQKEKLAQSGIAHLFAISGLHLGIIAAFLYTLFLSFFRHLTPLVLRIPPGKFIPVIILPVVAAYMMFTGGAISTLRALMSLAAITAALLLRRRVAPLQYLITAAFLILLFDPLALFTPGFQLSFAGAAGILSITPRWSKFCQGRQRVVAYPATLFMVTLAATVATLPFVLLHFHLLAPAGLLLNLLAVPMVTLLAVPLCLAGLVLSPIIPVGAAFTFSLAGQVLDTLLVLSDRVLNLPGFSGQHLYLTPPALLGAGILSLALLAPTTLRIRLIGGIAAIGFMFFPGITSQDSDQLRVVAISVGQGDAALVTTGAGKTLLIDGGGFAKSTFDTGERLVAPTLGYLGIGTIDAVVMSHNHPDHRNGLLHIINNFSVRNFWSPVAPEMLPDPLKSILTARRIPIRTFAENWTIVEQSGRSTSAVYRVPGSPVSTNDQSLVLYFRQGINGLLLTGDLESEGIAKLVHDPPPGPVTLLKFPHHGSRNSNPLPLINRFNPQVAYISVGHNNRYGQPAPSILSQVEKHPLQIERTDLSGSLSYTSKEQTWITERWTMGLFR